MRIAVCGANFLSMSEMSTTSARTKSIRRKAVAFVLTMNETGLGVARSLGRERIRVVGVDYVLESVGLRSRYCKPMLVPDPQEEPERVLKVLLTEGRKLDERGILYLAGDAFGLFVSRYRKELSECFRFIAPSPEGIFSKRLQYDEALRIGIPIASTFYPSTIDDVKRIKDSLKYPVFMKPYYSYLWLNKFGNKGFVIETPRQLMDRFNEVLPTGLQVMIQSIIPGQSMNIISVRVYIGTRGEILALFVAQKTRQHPTDFGTGTFTKSVHNEEVTRLSLDFLRGLGYRGICDIEFKKDPRDGQYKLIELNPRFWTQTIQATHAGVNFPLIQYMDLTGEPVRPITDFKDGVTWLDSWHDLLAFQDNWKKGRTSVTEFLKSWSGIDCHAHLALDDLGPVLAMLAKRRRELIIRLRRYLSESESWKAASGGKTA